MGKQDWETVWREKNNDGQGFPVTDETAINALPERPGRRMRSKVTRITAGLSRRSRAEDAMQPD